MTSWEPEALRALSLKIEPSGFVVTYTGELATFRELLETRDYACAVIGDSIPVYLRLELLRDAKQSKPNVPLVVIEGREAEIAEFKTYSAKIIKPSEPLSHLLRAIRSVTRKSKPQVKAESAIPLSKTDCRG